MLRQGLPLMFIAAGKGMSRGAPGGASGGAPRGAEVIWRFLRFRAVCQGAMPEETR